MHLESIRCPIFGDDLYAPPVIASGAARLALHAHRIAFSHPINGQAIDIRSSIPGDLKRLVLKLGMDPKKAQPRADEAAAEDSSAGTGE